jgi:hypothetical protein
MIDFMMLNNILLEFGKVYDYMEQNWIDGHIMYWDWGRDKPNMFGNFK